MAASPHSGQPAAKERLVLVAQHQRHDSERVPALDDPRRQRTSGPLYPGSDAPAIAGPTQLVPLEGLAASGVETQDIPNDTLGSVASA